VLECLADTLKACSSGTIEEVEEVMVKQVCTQLLHNLYSIDYKLLDSAVNKLSITRKTPIRKCIIEHETQQKQNKMLINVNEPVPILPTAEE